MSSSRPQSAGTNPLANASIADSHGGVQALLGRESKVTSGDVAASHQEPGTAAGEQQADADFAAGRYRSFNSHIEFLGELGVG